MATTVYIAIYDVLDERDPNHWAIFLQNPQKGKVILQVGDDKKDKGYYVEEPLYDKEPQRSSRHLASIEAGTISSDDHERAITLIQATPVDNESTTWNCQAWGQRNTTAVAGKRQFAPHFLRGPDTPPYN
ncbi:hypothetical protein VTH06DRAFT_953 [Thermothelomyces fergusii]